jgi:hypothetical protein
MTTKEGKKLDLISSLQQNKTKEEDKVKINFLKLI